MRYHWNKRRPSVTWEGYGHVEAEEYFARLSVKKRNAMLEMHLQLSLIGDHILKTISRLSPAQLAARNLEAGLENFYANYMKGPYTVQLRDVAEVNSASPLLESYPYAVVDGEQRPVLGGTQQECEAFAEELNVTYAQHIMVKK